MDNPAKIRKKLEESEEGLGIQSFSEVGAYSVNRGSMKDQLTHQAILRRRLAFGEGRDPITSIGATDNGGVGHANQPSPPS